MSDPLAPLRDRFRTRAKSDLQRLQDLAASDPAGDALQRLVHNIAGAAGTFGYASLSEAAMAIDDQFAAGLAPESAQLTLLQQRLRAVVSE